jgi:hypothetical protein
MTLATFRQMVAAELLKLWRRRGVIAVAAFFTIGIVVLFYGVRAIEHASSPFTHGPAGGVASFDRAIELLSVFFGALAAIVIGTEAGASDLSSGVFRDLVVTGRSRLSLFAVRVPAAIIVSWALTLAALGISLAAAYGFGGANSLPGAVAVINGHAQSAPATLGASFVVDGVLFVLLAQALLCTIAVGLGSLTGSRAATLTMLIGWELIANRLLSQVTFLGHLRELLTNVALGALKPGDPLPDSSGLVPSDAVAIVVIAGWILVFLFLGARSTVTRDA